MAKRRPLSARARYWKTERERYKKEHPKEFRDSERVVLFVRRFGKVLTGLRRNWREKKSIAEQTWSSLLDKASMPSGFVETFVNAHSLSQDAMVAEQAFLRFRGAASKSVLRKIDYNAIDRVCDLEEKINELTIEGNLFGKKEALAEKGLLTSFGKLVYSLGEIKDAKYAQRRETVAFFAKNLLKQRQRLKENAFTRRQKVLRRQISEKRARQNDLLDSLLLSQQSRNLWGASERLYSYLFQKAKAPELKKFLRMLVIESMVNMLRFEQAEILYRDLFERPEQMEQ